MEYGRYGLLGVDDDFSLSLDDRLNRIREEYNKRLMLYYANHSPRFYLKNNHCELRLIKNEKSISFYCKEKTNGQKKGRYFEIQGNDQHASTMWAIIDMEFTQKSDYNSIKELYYRLNQSMNTRGGLRYFYEPLLKKYPNFDDNYAQNEYCRLELKEGQNHQFVIICSEIWSKNPKQFVINGNKYLLQNIMSRFVEEKNKFYTYKELLAKYSAWYDAKVREINDISNNEIKENQEIEQSVQQKNPEPKKYIHVDLDEDKNQESVDIKEENQKENKKYDERHLDL